MTPKRIQLRRTKGWRMPPNTTKVDRSTKYGNPAKIGEIFEGEEVIDAAHAVTIFSDIYANEMWNDFNLPSPAELAADLGGKDQACWCPLDQPCHADVLLELANK